MAELSPTVQRVLDVLTAAGGERSSAEIAAAVGRPQAAVSHDLRRLIAAGRVEVTGRRANTFRYRAVRRAVVLSVPVTPSQCTCMHLVTGHRRVRGMAMSCQRCGCRVFVKAGTVARA